MKIPKSITPNLIYSVAVLFSAASAFGQLADTPTKSVETKVQPAIRMSDFDPDLPEGQEEANLVWKGLESGLVSRGQQADFTQKAANAKAFYERFPDHPKAIEARELEIISLLQGDHGNNSRGKSDLADRVTSFRSNSEIPSRKRAEVVKVFELRNATSGIKGNADHKVVFEEVARDLKTEFADTDVGDDLLLSVASQRGNKRGITIAQELEQSARSPENREKAKNLNTRLNLVGKSLNAAVPTMAKSAREQEGKLTVIYSWSINDRGSLANAKLLSQRNLDRANWIGINIDEGDQIELAEKYAAEGSFPGDMYYAGQKKGGGLAQKLGVDSSGVVMLLSEQGDFFDVHVADDLLRILGSFGL